MTHTVKQIKAMKETFKAAYPDVKCMFDKNTMVPSFVYQDGPALSKVQALLAPFGVQVIRVINARILGAVARKYLDKAYVTVLDSTNIRRGFHEGNLLYVNGHDEIKIMDCAQSMDASEMWALVK
jgi:hypothetical protein